MLNDTLEDLPIKKLKEICSEYEIPGYGSKSDIAERIKKNLLYETYSFHSDDIEIFFKDYRFDFIF